MRGLSIPSVVPETIDRQPAKTMLHHPVICPSSIGLMEPEPAGCPPAFRRLGVEGLPGSPYSSSMGELSSSSSPGGSQRPAAMAMSRRAAASSSVSIPER